MRKKHCLWLVKVHIKQSCANLRHAKQGRPFTCLCNAVISILVNCYRCRGSSRATRSRAESGETCPVRSSSSGAGAHHGQAEESRSGAHGSPMLSDSPTDQPQNVSPDTPQTLIVSAERSGLLVQVMFERYITTLQFPAVMTTERIHISPGHSTITTLSGLEDLPLYNSEPWRPKP